MRRGGEKGGALARHVGVVCHTMQIAEHRAQSHDLTQVCRLGPLRLSGCALGGQKQIMVRWVLPKVAAGVRGQAVVDQEGERGQLLPSSTNALKFCLSSFSGPLM